MGPQVAYLLIIINHYQPTRLIRSIERFVGVADGHPARLGDRRAKPKNVTGRLAPLRLTLRAHIPAMAPYIVADPGSPGRIGRRRRGVARHLSGAAIGCSRPRGSRVSARRECTGARPDGCSRSN